MLYKIRGSLAGTFLLPGIRREAMHVRRLGFCWFMTSNFASPTPIRHFLGYARSVAAKPAIATNQGKSTVKTNFSLVRHSDSTCQNRMVISDEVLLPGLVPLDTISRAVSIQRSMKQAQLL